MTDETPAITEAPKDSDKRKRRWLLAALILLLLILLLLCILFYSYWRNPQPLPDLIPIPAGESTPPHYLYSIYGVDRPVGIALSPTGDRIYVSESSGERYVKAFDLEGTLLFSFSTPGTALGERSPVYLDTDSAGNIYVSDRIQHAIYVFDPDGNYLDTILDQSLSLGEYIIRHDKSYKSGEGFMYAIGWSDVQVGIPGNSSARTLPAPDRASWAPLGVDFDRQGNLWITDVSNAGQPILQMPAVMLAAPAPWRDFDGELLTFGNSGEGQGEFLFPNSVATDSQERVFISDSNNGRVQVWSREGAFLSAFGRGTGSGGLSLPRGIAIDSRDWLYVVDAVGQDIKIFNVSASPPEFLFAIGEFGFSDGQFNYPNDIVVDNNGRIYIVDRENFRIQVWVY